MPGRFAIWLRATVVTRVLPTILTALLVARGSDSDSGPFTVLDPDRIHFVGTQSDFDYFYRILVKIGDYRSAPPAFAEEIAAHLSNALVVVFPGGAHSANNFDGLGGIMEQFVQTGSVDDLDLSTARDNRPLPLVG